MRSIVAYRRQSGLTLIELCTVILVLVIGAAIAVPALQALVDRQRHTSTLHTLTKHLGYARQQGVQRGQRVRVCPIDPSGVCGTDWSLGWHIVDAEDRVLLSTPNAHRRQRLLLFSPSATVIVYQSNGTTQMGNGTFVLCNTQGQPVWALVINRQGRLRHRTPETRDHRRCNEVSAQT